MRKQPTSLVMPRIYAATTTTALVLALSLAAPVPGARAELGAKSFQPRSLLGSYLAGRYARSRFDIPAAAAYYRHALRRDPGNVRLLEPAFMMEISNGNWSEAIPLARQLIKHKKTHRIANLMLGLAEFKSGDLAASEKRFETVGGNPIGRLTGVLARSWIKLKRGNAKQGIDLLAALTNSQGGRFHINYHSALIADVAGRTSTARAAYERLFKIGQRTLRIELAFANHAARAGDFAQAEKILQTHIKRNGGKGHILARDLMARIKARQTPALLVTNATDGLAETFYWLGEALTSVNAHVDGAVYLQLSLFMNPRAPFTLEALANVYEAARKYELALNTYKRIPASANLTVNIEIRKAMALSKLERVDEAKQTLEELATQVPADIRPLAVLGNIMRTRKRYKEAVGYYDKAIALIGIPQKKHWAYYYWRGTCFERTKRWPQAEVDLKKALELNPNQPQVLNYLGYSWVDQGLNLKEGMSLIDKAVRNKPDDGYIVDSLGWAHYRLRNFDKAVKHLERAVELRPEDPVLNDHLGDAFWRVGREIEARFQWNQSLTLKPEPLDEEKTKAKLANGLPAIVPPAVRPPAKAQKRSTTRQAKQSAPGGSPIR